MLNSHALSRFVSHTYQTKETNRMPCITEAFSSVKNMFLLPITCPRGRITVSRENEIEDFKSACTSVRETRLIARGLKLTEITNYSHYRLRLL